MSFYLFEGDYKKRREISLNEKHGLLLSKQNLLNQTHAQRLLRVEKRQKEKSAQTIKKYLSAKLTALKLTKSLKKDSLKPNLISLQKGLESLSTIHESFDIVPMYIDSLRIYYILHYKSYLNPSDPFDLQALLVFLDFFQKFGENVVSYAIETPKLCKLISVCLFGLVKFSLEALLAFESGSHRLDFIKLFLEKVFTCAANYKELLKCLLEAFYCNFNVFFCSTQSKKLNESNLLFFLVWYVKLISYEPNIFTTRWTSGFLSVLNNWKVCTILKSHPSLSSELWKNITMDSFYTSLNHSSEFSIAFVSDIELLTKDISFYPVKFSLVLLTYNHLHQFVSASSLNGFLDLVKSLLLSIQFVCTSEALQSTESFIRDTSEGFYEIIFNKAFLSDLFQNSSKLLSGSSALNSLWNTYLYIYLYSLPSIKGNVITYLVSLQQLFSIPLILEKLLSGYIISSNKNQKLGDSDFDWSHLIFLCLLLNHQLLIITDSELLSLLIQNVPFEEIIGVLIRFLISILLHLIIKYGNTWDDGSKCIANIRLPFIAQLFSQILWKFSFVNSRKQFCPIEKWNEYLPDVFSDEKNYEAFSLLQLEELQTCMEISSELFSLTVHSLEYQPRIQFNSPPHLVLVLLLLAYLPFVIPFNTRAHCFKKYIQEDQNIHYFSRHAGGNALLAKIRRKHEFEDGFLVLANASLKSSMKIAFIDEFGILESGVDGGGLTVEFINLVLKKAFSSELALFCVTQEQELYPNPQKSVEYGKTLNYYEYIGKLIGKAFYEGILIDIRFASFFIKKWLGLTNYLEDVNILDSEIYKSLLFLKNYTGNVEDLGLTFSIVSKDSQGNTNTVELIKNGATVPVVNENRLNYIYSLVYYKLNTQIQHQAQAFKRGLFQIINPMWLKIFTPDELQFLLTGGLQAIDVDDWKQNTTYNGFGTPETSLTIKYFWEVVSSFDEEYKKKVLKFCTSYSHPPLLGFKYLDPCFQISDDGEDISRLPSSSTCANILRLPRYENKELLKQKFLYILQMDLGFYLQ